MTPLISKFLTLLLMLWPTQYVATTFNAGLTGTAISANYGGTSVPQFYNYNEVGSPFFQIGGAAFTPLISPAYSSTTTSLGTWWDCSATTNCSTDTWSMALYADKTSGCASGDAHCAGTLICSTSIHTGITGDAYNYLTVSGCGTLTANTWYWVSTFQTADTKLNWGVNGADGQCGNTGYVSNYTASLISDNPWPSSAGAFNQSSVGSSSWDFGCEASIVVLNYTSPSTFNIVSAVAAPLDCSSGSTCITLSGPQTVWFPATQAGNNLVIMTWFGNGNSPTISAISTSASQTPTSIGTGCALGSVHFCNFGYYLTSVTTGTNYLDVTVSCGAGASCKGFLGVLEVQGMTASPLDRSHFDTTFSTTASWTGGSTSATSQAVELVVGLALNGQFASPEYCSSYTVTAPWILLSQGMATNSALAPFVMGAYITSSTGAVSMSGTSGPNLTCLDAYDTLTQVLTFK